MLHKITDGDKFVCYVSDAMNDQINEEVLKMLKAYDPTKKLNKPIHKKNSNNGRRKKIG